ncbi:putative Holliday junction resolvase-like endonuclease [Methanolinea mesophila]|uniref:Holliday junction resolvase-like protein n=1 Tax=Methanolinea mesophila TaxID=547055 RepID=UPI001AE388ED|nr:Holliday junction resolvase-like protein [Methanolinea mesophila]MBP1928566.1 putative Holliday junction resolvase-like endonuclease [Methanolinea mesophila]
MLEFALLLTIVALLILVVFYLRLRGALESRAEEKFRQWKNTTLESEASALATLYTREWTGREEDRIRKDAVKKSESVIQGKVTEHLIPYFPGFSYNPKDARFLGSPVDFVIFDGLSTGDLKKVVFIEVKSGRKPTLSSRERMVRDCIGNLAVSYEVLHHPGASGDQDTSSS